ncbi:RDD family protein [Ornithobacterium rhinotracheale]|uniref:RDD family protein n=1 Tax=Ornithobacterium rhinotracheale TaxID=28251 RepID=UPI001FF4345E|nr:RDD family protein [Ornithobacterium rhinotracheale]MCK0202709.1 RDD family protein [Ornithobacterium rhinotracheale]
MENEHSRCLICPICSSIYTDGAIYCSNDGSKLVREENLIPRCEICGTQYAVGVNFCPKDGGHVKVISAKSNVERKIGFKSQMFYPKADLLNRFFANLIDGFLGLIILIPFFPMCIAMIKDNKVEPFFVIMGLFSILGLCAFALLKDGGKLSSPGKSAMGLIVINIKTNQYCSFSDSFARNLISSLVGLIPFIGFLVEPIMVLVDENGRKIGDRVANTQVIDRKLYENGMRKL